MRLHIAWVLPLLLTFHCAKGSQPLDEGEGAGGVGAAMTGSGGLGGGTSVSSGTAANTSTGTASSSSTGAASSSSTGAASSSSTGTGGGSSASSSGSGGSDPCVGVSCTSPPPSFCKDSSYLTVNESPGTCTGGNCVYAQHDEWCASGCSMGMCNGDPCAGVSCTSPPASYCAGPNTLVTYASPGMCSGGVCMYTPSNMPCPFGCATGACLECSVNGDCPSGEWCNQSQCQPCNTNTHCGPTCIACSSPTPQCLNGTTCVQCLTSNDCAPGLTCSSNMCVAGCTPPTSACTSSGSQDSGCANPRVMTRTTAGSTSGYSQSAYGLCGRANDFPGGGGCNGYGGDAEYRLFMRAGESVHTTVTKYGYCNMSVGGNLTLKIFQAACDPGCTCAAPTTCPSSARVVCQAGASGVGQSIQNDYTADKDGWYTFVVDTEVTNENNFQFTMNVKLTCGSGGCGCT